MPPYRYHAWIVCPLFRPPTGNCRKGLFRRIYCALHAGQKQELGLLAGAKPRVRSRVVVWLGVTKPRASGSPWRCSERAASRSVLDDSPIGLVAISNLIR